MSRSDIPNRMTIDLAKKQFQRLAPEERKRFLDELGLDFISSAERVFADYTRLSLDERIEFNEMVDGEYCECGEELPENEDDHDCPLDRDDRASGTDEPRDSEPPSSGSEGASRDSSGDLEPREGGSDGEEDGFDGD